MKKAGPLPYTGLELALVVVGALALLLFGVGLRRLGRQDGLSPDVRACPSGR